MNLATQIPPRARSILYLVFALGVLALGATQVGYVTAEFDQPMWLTVAMAVWNFLGVGVGITAATHTPKNQTAEPVSVNVVNQPVAVERVGDLMAQDRVPGPDHRA